MKISVILGHPYPQSFNAAVAQASIAQLQKHGHAVQFHDLCAEKFNPTMEPNELVSGLCDDVLVKQHQAEIVAADGIVIIHPNWWGQPPAILKGWVDRVLREDIAYKFEEGDNGGGLPIGLLKAQVGIVFNTSNTPVEREEAVFGDPLERIWKDCIFDFCGVKAFERRMFRIIAGSDVDERKAWLHDVCSIIDKHFAV